MNNKGFNDTLLSPGDRVLAAVSGGADSVCLLHMLTEYSHDHNITVFAAHVNHSLRDEADAEEEYVKELCKNLGVVCFTTKLDIAERAARLGIGTEQAGRAARYEFFRSVCESNNLNKTATAHHMNDNAETILMHFIRGAGLRGLCGISPSSGGIIRPILGMTRSDTENYCRENSLKYCTDKTNFETDYSRNRVRLVTIPEIEKDYNPSFCATVTQAARSMREDLDFMEGAADAEYDKLFADGSLDLAGLCSLHPALAKRCIRRYISDVCGSKNDIYSVYTDAVYSIIKKGVTGKHTNIPGGYIALVEYGRLIIKKPEIPEDYEYTVIPGAYTDIPEAGIRIYAAYTDKISENCFEAGKNSLITIRNRRSGDTFHPCGMNGTKKLKDYYIDEKMPQNRRARQPLLTIDGEIAWIIEKRRDARFFPSENYIKISVEKLTECRH